VHGLYFFGFDWLADGGLIYYLDTEKVWKIKYSSHHLLLTISMNALSILALHLLLERE